MGIERYRSHLCNVLESPMRTLMHFALSSSVMKGQGGIISQHD